jgi:hypothetical protein
LALDGGGCSASRPGRFNLLINDEKVKDPEVIANTFNTFLLTITENLNLHQEVSGDATSFLKEAFPRKFPGINTILTTETEIKSIIHSLRTKHSSGYGRITSKISKVCTPLNSHPLTHIYNHSLFTGIFPDCLKISVIRPLYKKGDKTSMTIFRPISLFTTFSKVLEKVMHIRLSHYCQTNSILVSEQFGFRNGISTKNAAFKLTVY